MSTGLSGSHPLHTCSLLSHKDNAAQRHSPPYSHPSSNKNISMVMGQAFLTHIRRLLIPLRVGDRGRNYSAISCLKLAAHLPALIRVGDTEILHAPTVIKDWNSSIAIIKTWVLWELEKERTQKMERKKKYKVLVPVFAFEHLHKKFKKKTKKKDSEDFLHENMFFKVISGSFIYLSK